MASEAQRRASDKYNKANTKMYPVRVNKKTESDIYDKLENVDNISGYIKSLIRADMKNTK